MKNLPYTVALLALLTPLTSTAPIPGDHATQDDLDFVSASPVVSVQFDIPPKPDDIMTTWAPSNDQRGSVNVWEQGQQFYPGQHDLCDPPRFHPSETNPSSPLARDCVALADSLWAGGVHIINTLNWGVSSHQKLFAMGTCAFGVHLQDIHASFWGDKNTDVSPHTVVGNHDMAEAIYRSVSLFQSPNGRVGAQGSFLCHGIPSVWEGPMHYAWDKVFGSYDENKPNLNVVWQIYHAAAKAQWG